MTSREPLEVVLLHAWAGEGRCGVVDYTNCLADALRAHGENVVVHSTPDWSSSSVRTVRRFLATVKGNAIIHLQYPSLNAGRSLWPAMLPFFAYPSPTLVTFHEFQAFNPLRKAALSCIPALAAATILTNAQDERLFRRWYPHTRGHTSVIPIGSNIVRSADALDSNRTIAAVFFGQLRRKRGLEEFFAFAGELRMQGIDAPIACIGAIVETDPGFERWLRESADAHNVDLHLNAGNELVSALLSRSSLAYLPFPDGLSERRGSVLACLDHDVTILSTHTQQTPEWLRTTTVHASAPAEAAAIATGLLNTPRARTLSSAAARERRAREWPTIAAQHCALYEASSRSVVGGLSKPMHDLARS